MAIKAWRAVCYDGTSFAPMPTAFAQWQQMSRWARSGHSITSSALARMVWAHSDRAAAIARGRFIGRRDPLRAAILGRRDARLVAKKELNILSLTSGAIPVRLSHRDVDGR